MNNRGRTAFVGINSYAGRYEIEVTIIAETPKKYRVTPTKDSKWPGRDKILKAGESALVPKTSVRLANI